MYRNFLSKVKCLVVAIMIFVLLIQAYQIPVLATETKSESIEGISELADEITYFYLDPRAADFMSSFYTRESYENLRDAFNQTQMRKVSGWEIELDNADLKELYQLLSSAVTNLRPLTIRRGEAISRNQNLNFRSVPETQTQVLYTLAYGTSFEILEEVQGGVVIGEDNVHNNRWFRIRHDAQLGYVHARYVRVLSVSEERIRLLADIARQELWIQTKIDGWRTDFSSGTQNDLQEVLNYARTLQVGNWQFDLNYSNLNHILQSLTYEHLDLITLFRYNLINDIVGLRREIEDNVQGSGSSRMEQYTKESWNKMYTDLVEAQVLLIENWQHNLNDEELEFIHELLFSGLNGLELIIQSGQTFESETEMFEVESNFNHEQIFILAALALAALMGIALILAVIIFIFKVINLSGI